MNKDDLLSNMQRWLGPSSELYDLAHELGYKNNGSTSMTLAEAKELGFGQYLKDVQNGLLSYYPLGETESIGAAQQEIQRALIPLWSKNYFNLGILDSSNSTVFHTDFIEKQLLSITLYVLSSFEIIDWQSLEMGRVFEILWVQKINPLLHAPPFRNLAQKDPIEAPADFWNVDPTRLSNNFDKVDHSQVKTWLIGIVNNLEKKPFGTDWQPRE